MRILLALIIGVAIGAAALWFFTSQSGKSSIRSTGQQIESATKPARDAIQESVKSIDLRPETIKDELARSGQVVRKKAQEAGKAIADATADTRITAAIKAKLVADRSVPGLSISVNTTAGVVTLSGAVSSAEEISKAIAIAMDVEGVQEVISTLQIKGQGRNG